MTIRTAARRVGGIAATTGMVLGLAAAPAGASKVSGDPRALDFAGKMGRYIDGLSCSAVPTTEGGSIALTTLVLTDSSKRVAAVRYTLGGGGPMGIPGYPMGDGKVMVLKATQDLEGVGSSAERPGPPAARRSTCSYDTNRGAQGWAELVHLEPVVRPTAAEVTAWCETQSWYPHVPYACPSGGLA